jgi:hypothetical protein
MVMNLAIRVPPRRNRLTGNAIRDFIPKFSQLVDDAWTASS